MSIDIIRHKGIFNPQNNDIGISVIGCGAIGSRIAEGLINLGLENLQFIDYDSVETHNLANQIYGYDDLSVKKVRSLEEFYKFKTDLWPPKSMQFLVEKMPSDNVELMPIVFLAVDSMAARREIFECSLRENLEVLRVFEIRMGAVAGEIRSFNPEIEHECDNWIDSLINDADAEVSACGSSLAVGTTASIVANMAVMQLIHFLTNPNAIDNLIKINLQPFSLYVK